MADQRLFRMDRSIRYQHIEPLFSGTLNRELILGRWDDLLRVAGSVKMGWVTASLLIGKLQSYRRQNALMRALQEYGRLIKTIHIVRCLDSPEYRRAIGRQLNKGEQLHNLRRFMFFANEGEIGRSQFEDQTTQVLCLNLAANAIITWNTVYMAEALGAIRVEGIAVDDDGLVHVPPTLWSHVNVYGKYEFDVDAGGRRNGLRPLRQASAASA